MGQSVAEIDISSFIRSSQPERLPQKTPFSNDPVFGLQITPYSPLLVGRDLLDDFVEHGSSAFKHDL